MYNVYKQDQYSIYIYKVKHLELGKQSTIYKYLLKVAYALQKLKHMFSY